MKEYIYLDMELINSYLAQIDEGLLLKSVVSQSEINTNQEDGGNTTTFENSGQVGIPAVVNGTSKYSKTEVDKFNTVYSKNNTELIESALNDYSLDVLLKRLEENNLLKLEFSELTDGNFIFTSDKFDIFNFDQLKTSVEKENLQNILFLSDEDQHSLDLALVELDKLSKTPQLRVKHKDRISYLKNYISSLDTYSEMGSALQFSKYASILFPDTILLKAGIFMSICNASKFRINIPILTFLSQTKRKISLLGIVIFRRDESLEPDDEPMDADAIISTGPAMFSDIILSNFNLIKTDDYYVRPIAIFFDHS
ncbi:DUF6414 family protein [Enterococcus italicus]|uniref:DUF6414 family protein n=1 Tax=Enterococcus italicus TaxID=246144 RepID=UPI0020735808|nr:hypothetical protein [Enterococcus italicus]